MAIDFPDSPSVNDTFTAGGKVYQWDGTVWEIYGPNVSPGTFKIDDVNNRVGINNASPSVTLDVTGDAVVSGDLDVTGEFTSRGYRYVDTLYFTSSGTFTKATYPWLRAVRVKCQAGGGGSGSGDAMSAGEAVASGGGGGGCYAESFITDIASLAASVTVTVGSGGAGGAGGAGDGVSGTDGGDSEFGAGTAYEVSAGGGNGGARGFESALNGFGTGTSARRVGTGDLVLGGGAGASGFRIGTTVSGAVVLALGGVGGDSVLGRGGRGADLAGTTIVELGQTGTPYGGGAGGSAGVCDTGTQNGPDGRSGGDGIVIVELYA